MGPGELRRIAQHLGTTVRQLRAEYAIRYLPGERAYELTAGPEGCPLLTGDHCSVHSVKPAQCHTYPFWPELVEDRGAWHDAKSVCEGLDDPEGPIFSLAEMRARARAFRFG